MGFSAFSRLARFRPSHLSHPFYSAYRLAPPPIVFTTSAKIFFFIVTEREKQRRSDASLFFPPPWNQELLPASLTKKRDDDYPRSPFSRSTLLPRERSHASRISAPSGRDRFLAAFSTPIGPEESVPTRIGAAGAEMGEEREWDAAGTTGREAGWQACARARGGGEGRRAVGGRDRKTRVDCPCALGWLLERWHSDAYLRLPGVPFAPSFAAFLYHSRKRDLVSFRGKKFIGDSSPIFHVFF